MTPNTTAPRALVRILTLLLVATTAHIAGADGPDSVRIVLPEHPPVISGELPATSHPMRRDSIAPAADAAAANAPQWWSPTMPAWSPATFMPEPTPMPAWQHRFTIPAMTLIPGGAPITGWRGGGLYASGSRSSAAGLMGVETGTLNVSQDIGPLSITAYGTAVKTGFFRGLTTQWGFGGALTYSFSPTVSLTLYGSYYTRAAGVANPGIREVMPVGSFGGYIDWRFAGCWGVKVGATAQQSIFSGRHEVRPTVIPYFHLGPGADIGVDVGGILYELLRSKSSYGPRNPTLGPIKPGPPPVGPRN